MVSIDCRRKEDRFADKQEILTGMAGFIEEGSADVVSTTKALLDLKRSGEGDANLIAFIKGVVG